MNGTPTEGHRHPIGPRRDAERGEIGGSGGRGDDGGWGTAVNNVD